MERPDQVIMGEEMRVRQTARRPPRITRLPPHPTIMRQTRLPDEVHQPRPAIGWDLQWLCYLLIAGHGALLAVRVAMLVTAAQPSPPLIPLFITLTAARIAGAVALLAAHRWGLYLYVAAAAGVFATAGLVGRPTGLRLVIDVAATALLVAVTMRQWDRTR